MGSPRKFRGILTTLITASALCGLAGCNGSPAEPGNPAAYEGNGLCSPQYVSAYEATAKAVNFAQTGDDFDKADQSVSAFASQYQGVSCQATNSQNGALSSLDANSLVNSWRDTIASGRARLAANSPSPSPSPAPSPGPNPSPGVNPSPEPEPQPAASPRPTGPAPVKKPTPSAPPSPAPSKLADPSSLVHSLPDGFDVLVRDSAALQSALATARTAGEGVFIQKGASSAEPASGTPAGNYCVLGASAGLTLSAGEWIDFTRVTDEDGLLIAEAPLASASFALDCVKTDGTAFTLADLNAIFGTLASVVAYVPSK